MYLRIGKVLAFTLVLVALFSLDGQVIAAKSQRLQQPTIKSISYEKTAKKVVIDWKGVTNAKRYRLKVYRRQKLLYSTTTKKTIKSVKSSLFKSDTTYRFRLLAMKTQQYRASDWTQKKYTHPTAFPTLTPLVDAISIDGINIWGFIVNDGEEQPAISGETDEGRVRMGRINLESPSTSLNWTDAIQPADFGNKNIADHWHLFAHGFHWIAVSVDSATESYLIKLDTDFSVLGIFEIAIDETYQNDEGQTLSLLTNDLLMVEELDGVAIGHFMEGTGHRLFRFDTSGNLIETVDIGGGDYTHANGASALATEDGYLLFAPTTLNPSQESMIKLITFNQNWEPQSVTTLIEEDGMNIAMATGVIVEDDFIVTARVVDTESKISIGDDSGSIVRYVFDENLTQQSREKLYTDTGNRPHTTAIDEKLITVWDSSSVVLQIDTIND